MTAFGIVDLLAVAVFATSGALAGARKGLDLIGLIWLAAITGIGGGTLRDLLIGVPVFWVYDPLYLAVITGMAIVMFFVASVPKQSETALLWLDAAGLAFTTCAGTAKAFGVGIFPPVAVLMGVITATFGGIVRDLLVGDASILMRREIYITAALLGSGVFVIAKGLGAYDWTAFTLGILAGFALRAGALLFGWALPGARMGHKRAD